VIERRQSFQDPPLTDCEQCQGRLQRVLQPVGIIFRASGFYSTDYRSGASNTGNGASEKPDSAATSEGAKESGSSSGASKPSAGKDTTPTSSSSS
jgi:predicted nucleic acid-binding Zn ribbon protein